MSDIIFKEIQTSGKLEDCRKFLRHCLEHKIYKVGYVFGKYFLNIYDYDFEIKKSFADILYNLENFEESYDIYNRLIKTELANDCLTEITYKMDTCVSKIHDRYTYYDKEKIKSIVPNNTLQLITFTITTCKRYCLFEKTMNSFINCCTDLDKINRWICIDDNSSEEDRKLMKEKYPFLEFYFKTPQDKGHPRSMNMLKNMINTPYVFHLEDDWQFFSKDNYITRCLEVVNEREDYGQCLINKNYAEIGDIVGGHLHFTKNRNTYLVHEYCSNQESQNAFNLKYGGRPNCAYWPHFSLRPGLTKTTVWRDIGDFNETIAHFEMDYSYRYLAKKYITTFLPNISCMHIGRLTSERFDSTKLNAYILNGEKQFEDKSLNFKTKIINLDRRTDRWDKICGQTGLKFLNYERFSAIDGNLLQPTEQLQRIFEGNDYNMKAGMVGCALSHIQLTINLLNDRTDAYFIMEDDNIAVDNFEARFKDVISKIDKNFDIVYIGYHLWGEQQDTGLSVLEKWDSERSLKESIGGCNGYIISKSGAKKLLDFINVNGMTNCIDTIQQKMASTLNIYYCVPMLLKSSCWTNNRDVDTDIQNNFNSLTIPPNIRYKNEINFYKNIRRIVIASSIEDIDREINNRDCVIFYFGNQPTGYKYQYSLDGNMKVVVPEPDDYILNNRYFQRLKNYDIKDALKFKIL